MLLRGICSGEVQAHEQTGLVMNHLVQEGEYKYGDMGEDTVIKLTLDQECEEYNAKLANAKSNHGVINYYTVRGLPVPE
jgi:hypothetical protein